MRDEARNDSRAKSVLEELSHIDAREWGPVLLLSWLWLVSSSGSSREKWGTYEISKGVDVWAEMTLIEWDLPVLNQLFQFQR